MHKVTTINFHYFFSELIYSFMSLNISKFGLTKVCVFRLNFKSNILKLFIKISICNP